MSNLVRLSPLSNLNGESHPLVRLVGASSRLLLNKWCKNVEVRGLDRFLSVIQDQQRIKKGKGVLTYANHISVLDDPTLFGCLPSKLLHNAISTRWTLGASDIMFTNSFNAFLFRSGQVLPTDRGRGVFQPALDRSIDILERGGWVHMFPEGYVNMSRIARVRRFKWGIARILLEAIQAGRNSLPIIIPIWISGFDFMMPEPRSSPRWLPRPGAEVQITFGEPINEEFEPVIEKARKFISNVKGKDYNLTSKEELVEGLKNFMHDTKTISSSYPIPEKELFSAPTPLKPPPGGVPWPLPMENSRSYLSLASNFDSERARITRSFISAELRAHLVQLGDSLGPSKPLAHKLMGD